MVAGYIQLNLAKAWSRVSTIYLSQGPSASKPWLSVPCNNAGKVSITKLCLKIYGQLRYMKNY